MIVTAYRAHLILEFHFKILLGLVYELVKFVDHVVLAFCDRHEIDIHGVESIVFVSRTAESGSETMLIKLLNQRRNEIITFKADLLIAIVNDDLNLLVCIRNIHS